MARAVLLSVASLALAGCGAGSSSGPSPACTDTPQSIEQALRTAPAQVHLADGTRLSACIDQAQGDGQLQSVGSTLSSVADDLAAKAAGDRSAAVQLGYLVGAVRRGARHINGTAAELVRRLEQAASSSAVAPFAAGLHAGELSG